MRLHTNAAGAVGLAIYSAGEALPGVGGFNTYTTHRSATHERAIELKLTGNGRQGRQWGNADGKGATWDEWGAVLAAAFAADERAREEMEASGVRCMPMRTAGAVPYESHEHFRWATAGRYDDGMPFDAHAAHRWTVREVVTGAYNVQSCSGCSAVIRRMAPGRAFAEING